MLCINEKISAFGQKKFILFLGWQHKVIFCLKEQYKGYYWTNRGPWWRDLIVKLPWKHPHGSRWLITFVICKTQRMGRRKYLDNKECIICHTFKECRSFMELLLSHPFIHNQHKKQSRNHLHSLQAYCFALKLKEKISKTFYHKGQKNQQTRWKQNC